MNGIDFVADTNAVVYLLAGNDCMRPYISKSLGVSIITVMELLSYKNISDEEERTIREFLAHCQILNITDDVKETTIILRRNFNVKLPDAIIAATAKTQDVSLITADAGLFNIKGVSVEQLAP